MIVEYRITNEAARTKVNEDGRTASVVKNVYGSWAYNVTIPDSVTLLNGKKYRVTAIGKNAFMGCSGLMNVDIPNSVIKIGENAFERCSGLTSIVIPDSVTEIGAYAFSGCSGLTSVVIPNSVTKIGKSAFYDCRGLTSVVIPDSVTAIGEEAFKGCDNLESIVVGKGNLVYDSRENCNAIIETKTNKLLIGCKNTVIPDSVTSIGKGAFWRCHGLASIVIPDSINEIGAYAFWSGGIRLVIIPKSVTKIETNAIFNGSCGPSQTIHIK